jgi:hypothetical protein
MLKVTSSWCREGEFANILQSENSPVPLTQTSRDSPTTICPFENSNSCPSEDIGSALCSSNGISSPSHSSNISDL